MRLSIKLFTLLCTTASMLALNGCGYVSKGLTSEADLIDRAALSIGIGRQDIKIIPGSVQAGMESVTYRVQESNGALYTCQYTTMMVTSGDAICQKTSEGIPRQPPAQPMGTQPGYYGGATTTPVNPNPYGNQNTYGNQTPYSNQNTYGNPNTGGTQSYGTPSTGATQSYGTPSTGATQSYGTPSTGATGSVGTSF